jgi:hypothetical protein
MCMVFEELVVLSVGALLNERDVHITRQQIKQAQNHLYRWDGLDSCTSCGFGGTRMSAAYCKQRWIVGGVGS